MEKVKESVGPKGLQIPVQVLKRSGLEVGTPVIIELYRSWIRIAPERIAQPDIENSALSYLLHNVGDAIGIDSPVQSDDQWLVPVVLPYAQKRVGQLVFSLSGNLLPAKSSSVEEMLGRIDEA